MTSTIIGLFDNPAQAEQARSEIVALNIPSVDVQVYDNAGFQLTGGTDTSTRGFGKASRRLLPSVPQTRPCIKKAFDVGERLSASEPMTAKSTTLPTSSTDAEPWISTPVRRNGRPAAGRRKPVNPIQYPIWPSRESRTSESENVEACGCTDTHPPIDKRGTGITGRRSGSIRSGWEGRSTPF